MTSDDWGIQARWIDADDQAREVPEVTIQRLRQLIGRPPTDLEDRAPVVARAGQHLRLGRVESGARTGRGAASTARCPATSRWLPPDAVEEWTRTGTDRLPRAVLAAARLAGLGLVGPAVRHPVAGELGHRRPGRPAAGAAVRPGAGRRLPDGQSPARSGTDAPQEASPYLPTSRRFLNPLYLRVEEVPGAEVPRSSVTRAPRPDHGVSSVTTAS